MRILALTEGSATVCKPGWTIVALLAGSLSFGTRAAHGQDAAPIGTKVVIKSDARLRVGRQVVDTNAVFRVYKVKQVNGNWLWLTADTVSGWVKSTHVIPFEQAIEFYTQRNSRQSECGTRIPVSGTGSWSEGRDGCCPRRLQ